MCFIGVEVEQETSAPPPKKNPGSAPDSTICFSGFYETKFGISFVYLSLWLLLWVIGLSTVGIKSKM